MNNEVDIQKRRKAFFGSLRVFFKRANVKFSSAMPDEQSIIVCSRVEDFDPKSNELWTLRANKSFPRDAECGDCKKPVVMSDAMFAGYVAGQRQSKIKCAKCLLKI